MEKKTKPSSWILITGASTGIGYALAKKYLKEGHYNLALVSQNKERLNKAKLNLEKDNHHHIKITTLAVDLSKTNGPDIVYSTFKKKNIDVDILINNAGFGLFGPFHKYSYTEQGQLLNTNINTLVQLCHLFGNDMLHRNTRAANTNQEKNSKDKIIINVASIAGFLPGPLLASYYASKAFVLHFSEGLHEELADKGIFVSALCPGYTRTSFHERSGTNRVRFTHGILARLFAMSSDTVAEITYKGIKQKKTIIIPGLLNKLTIIIIKLSPRTLVRKISLLINTDVET